MGERCTDRIGMMKRSPNLQTPFRVIKRGSISDETGVRLSTSTWLATNQHDKEYRKKEVVLERVRFGIRCQLKTEGVCGQ